MGVRAGSRGRFWLEGCFRVGLGVALGRLGRVIWLTVGVRLLWVFFGFRIDSGLVQGWFGCGLGWILEVV